MVSLRTMLRRGRLAAVTTTVLLGLVLVAAPAAAARVGEAHRTGTDMTAVTDAPSSRAGLPPRQSYDAAPPPPMPEGCPPKCAGVDVDGVFSHPVARRASTKITYPGEGIDFETPTSCGDRGCTFHRLHWRAASGFTLGDDCTSTSMTCSVTYDPWPVGDSSEAWGLMIATHSNGHSRVSAYAYAFYAPPTLYPVRLDPVDTKGAPVWEGSVGYAVRAGADPVEVDCVDVFWYASVVKERNITAPPCIELVNDSSYTGWFGLHGVLPNSSGTWTIVGAPLGDPARPLLSRPSPFRRLTLTPADDDMRANIVREYRPRVDVAIVPEKYEMELGTTQRVKVVVRAVNGEVGSLQRLTFDSADILAVSGYDTALAIVGPVESIPAPGFSLGTSGTRTFTVTVRAVGMGYNGLWTRVNGYDDQGSDVTDFDSTLVAVTYTSPPPPPPPPPPGTSLPDGPKPPVIDRAWDLAIASDPNADSVQGHVEGSPGTQVVVSLVTSATVPCSKQMSGTGVRVIASFPVRIGSDGKGTFTRNKDLTRDWFVYGVTTVGSKVSRVGDCGPVTAEGTAVVHVTDPVVREGSSTAKTAMSFTVSLSEPRQDRVTVQYSTTNGTATTGAGAATAPGDYAAKPLTTLAFQPGERVKTVTVELVADAVDEMDERLFLTLRNPVNAVLVPIDGSGSDAQGVGTIADDDGPRIQVSDGTAIEGTSATGYTPMRFTIRLAAPSPQVVWVRFGTVAASAVGSTGSATAGSDYVAIDRSASSSLVRFAAGETSRVVIARVRQDGAVERDERFALTLSAPVNGSLVPPGTTEVATDSRGIGVIRDDDATPVARIADATIAEGTGTGTTAVRLVITLSSPSWRSVSVRFGTVDGTAKGGSASAAGADYVSVVPAATTSLVTFAPGVQTATITVQVRKDAAREVAETFFVDLSSAVNATLRALDGSTNDRRGVVSIRNDD